MSSPQQAAVVLSDEDAIDIADNLTGLLRAGGTLASALDITDDECEALYALGYGMYEQGRYGDALKVFAQLVAYNHLEPRYLLALGGAARMLGRYEDALQQYVAVAVMKLDDPVPLYHSAECLVALEKLPEAAESLELALALCADEGSHDALKTRASALLQAIESRLNEA